MDETKGLIILIAFGVIFVALMVTMVFCYLFIYADQIIDYIKKDMKMENERIINHLERELFELSRLKKEGKKVEPLIKRTEVILFEAVDEELQTHHHFEEWNEELTPTEKKVQKLHDQSLGISEERE